jgi:hypothetical protein
MKKADESESKQSPNTRQRRLFKKVKVVVSMDDVVMQRALRDKALQVEPDTKLKEEDPFRILLYDANELSRKRAAKLITKEIESQVRGARRSSLEGLKGVERPVLFNLSLKDLKGKLTDCFSLRDKLEKIDDIRLEIYGSTKLPPLPSNSVRFAGKLDLFEEIMKTSKSSDKLRRAESTDPTDLFNHNARQRTIKFNTRLSPSEFVSFTLADSVKELKKLANKLAESDLQEVFASIMDKVQTLNAPAVLLNSASLRLPDCGVSKLEGLYLTSRFNCMATLKEVNLSGNSIGDVVGYSLVKVLARYADELEQLNLARTKVAARTAEALGELLAKPKLRGLNLAHNLIDDRSLEGLLEPLIASVSLENFSLSNNPLSQTGSLLIARLVRGNKSLKSLTLNALPLSGQPIHDISRSLIVNPVLKSISLDKCELSDADVKQLCFSLAVNRTLSLLSLADNSLTKAALKTLSLMLARNSSLLHIGLSANTLIRLEHFEQWSVPKSRELVLAKQEDLCSVKELKGLTRYINARD